MYTLWSRPIIIEITLNIYYLFLFRAPKSFLLYTLKSTSGSSIVIQHDSDMTVAIMCQSSCDCLRGPAWDSIYTVPQGGGGSQDPWPFLSPHNSLTRSCPSPGFNKRSGKTRVRLPGGVTVCNVPRGLLRSVSAFESPLLPEVTPNHPPSHRAELGFLCLG